MEILLVNPLVEAFRGSDPFGKAIFFALFLLSIMTWGIFFQKFILQKNVKQKGEKFQEIFQRKRLNPLGLEVGEESLHPFAELYRILKYQTIELLNKNKGVMDPNKEGIFLSSSDIDLIEAHLASSISAHTKRFEKNLFVLSTVTSLAPFLGLLGTVWGILLTFSELQAGSGGQTNDVVMGGLAMALGTTVTGLVVAIPALIAYNYLRSTTVRLSTDMEDFSNLLLASVELQYRKVDVR